VHFLDDLGDLGGDFQTEPPWVRKRRYLRKGRAIISALQEVRTHMPGYWIARAKITDPVAYKKYTDLVPDIINQYGGKILARGGRYQIMEGPEVFQRFVVIEFPTLEQAVTCFQSPEYQHAAAFRRDGGGVVENVIVEGI
jgi:uncharacterized protein (DUF1330 family)